MTKSKKKKKIMGRYNWHYIIFYSNLQQRHDTLKSCSILVTWKTVLLPLHLLYSSQIAVERIWKRKKSNIEYTVHSLPVCKRGTLKFFLEIFISEFSLIRNTLYPEFKNVGFRSTEHTHKRILCVCFNFKLNVGPRTFV